MIAVVVAASILLAPPPPGPTLETEATIIKHLTRAWVAAQEEGPPAEGSSTAVRPDEAAPPAPSTLPAADWLPLVAAYFEPADHDTALCLIWAESRGDPGAINPTSGARGLMQILPAWAPIYGVATSDLLDPATNLAIAADLKAKEGWSQWSPWNRGECQ